MMGNKQARMHPQLHHFKEKPPEDHSLTLNPQESEIKTFFQKNHLAQTMGPIDLYPLAKNQIDPQSRFGEKEKK